MTEPVVETRPRRAQGAGRGTRAWRWRLRGGERTLFKNPFRTWEALTDRKRGMRMGFSRITAEGVVVRGPAVREPRAGPWDLPTAQHLGPKVSIQDEPWCPQALPHAAARGRPGDNPGGGAGTGALDGREP